MQTRSMKPIQLQSKKRKRKENATELSSQRQTVRQRLKAAMEIDDEKKQEDVETEKNEQIISRSRYMPSNMRLRVENRADFETEKNVQNISKSCHMPSNVPLRFEKTADDEKEMQVNNPLEEQIQQLPLREQLRMDKSKGAAVSERNNLAMQDENSGKCSSEAWNVQHAINEQTEAKGYHASSEVRNVNQVETSMWNEFHMRYENIEENSMEESSKFRNTLQEEESRKFRDALHEDNEQASKMKRVRGRSKMPPPLKPLAKRVNVFFNESNQPITEDGESSFSNFLGHVARNFIPINCKDYRSVPKENVRTAMKVVLARYQIEEKCHYDYVKGKIGDLWRKEKSNLRLRAECLFPSVEERIKNPPDDIDEVEWEEFILQTLDPKYQALRERNKKIRANKEPHYTGRRSFARVFETLKEKNLDANRCDLLRVVNTRKDGSKNNTAKKLDEAVLAGKNGEEAINHVFGPEKNGNVRGLGFRVCPTVYNHLHPLVENRKKYEAELLDKIAERIKMIVEQTLAEKLQGNDKGFRDTLPSISHSGNKRTLESTSKASAPDFPKNATSKSISKEYVEQLGDKEISRSIPKACSQLPGNKTRSENSSKESIMVPMKTSQSQRFNIGRPCILFLFHENNIIAEGTLISTSSDSILHNGAMDRGCYKVSIDKVIKEDAYLPCPTKEFIMVVDAYKSFVAWPSQYIKML